MRVFLAILLLTMWEAAQSQEPTPTPSVASQQLKSQLAKTHKRAAANPSGTDRNPFVVKSIEAEKTPERTEQERSEQEESAANERRLTTWTIVLAVATCILVLIAGGQLRMFWIQLGLIRESLVDTKEVADAAKISADAAEQTVSTMKDTAQKQLRAHVFPEVGDISNVANPLPHHVVPNPNHAGINFPRVGPIASVVIKNFGQTPAYEVIHWMNIHLQEFPLRNPLPRRQKHPGFPFTKSTLGPGGKTSKSIKLNAPLTNQQIADLRAGNSAIYVYGVIVYKDAFGKRQRTYFRLMHVEAAGAIGISTALTGYGEGNEAT